MAEKVDQDVREAAVDAILAETGGRESDVRKIRQGMRDDDTLVQALAAMKEAGRQQGLREAAEVVMAKTEGVRKKARRDRKITDGRCGLVLGYEDAEAAITALMEGEQP